MDAKIIDIIDETPDVKTFVLDINVDFIQDVDFYAGGFLRAGRAGIR